MYFANWKYYFKPIINLVKSIKFIDLINIYKKINLKLTQVYNIFFFSLFNCDIILFLISKYIFYPYIMLTHQYNRNMYKL